MMARPSDAELAEAFARCERIVRERAKNFWYGLRLTPEPKRSAMYAIYAWMREADDIADGDDHATAQDPAGREARLAAFRADTDRALAGDVPPPRPDADARGRDRAAMWRALAAIAPTYRLEAKDFHDMIDGQLADLGAVRMETWADLRAQCYRVASTVGLVCVRVWGLSPAARDGGERVRDRVRELAIDRGIAFQLTNILRDVREDREVGRVYLPTADLERHGLTIDSLLAWSDARRCEAFLAAEIARAEQHYRSSEGLEELISPECVPTLWAMTSIYRQLLDRIAGDPKAIVGASRVRLATWQKLWIGFRAKRMAAKSKPVAGTVAAEVATP